jgi:hypothetical protein
MSNTHPLTVRVPSSLNETLEHVAHDAQTSKSELVRSILHDHLEDGDHELPDHLETELERERAKRRNSVEWQRVYWRSNVAERFKRAFKQGDLDGDVLGENAIETIRDSYVEDAEIMFDGEKRERAVQYVKALAEHARQATDESDFDRLDPETMFSKYGGVVSGSQREGTDVEKVVAEARERTNGHLYDDEAVASALSKQFGITHDLALECVHYATGRRESIDGVEVER